MRGGFLPPAILCAAIGLVLAFLPFRKALLAAALVATAAILVFVIAPDAAWIEPIFVGCWLSVIGCALLLLRPAHWPVTICFVAAVNAGLWTGATASVAGGARDLAIALPLVLILLPGHAIVARGWQISLKVLASWLTAVAILATMVSLTPTPGYLPDHME